MLTTKWLQTRSPRTWNQSAVVAMCCEISTEKIFYWISFYEFSGIQNYIDFKDNKHITRWWLSAPIVRFYVAICKYSWKNFMTRLGKDTCISQVDFCGANTQLAQLSLVHSTDECIHRFTTPPKTFEWVLRSAYAVAFEMSKYFYELERHKLCWQIWVNAVGEMWCPKIKLRRRLRYLRCAVVFRLSLQSLEEF